MDKEAKKELMKDFIERYKEKGTIKVGQTFEMFGCKYVACNESDCDSCVFRDAQCDLNVDIPSCANNIHFEIAKNKKFTINHVILLTKDYEIEGASEEEAILNFKKKIVKGEIKRNEMDMVSTKINIIE